MHATAATKSTEELARRRSETTKIVVLLRVAIRRLRRAHFRQVREASTVRRRRRRGSITGTTCSAPGLTDDVSCELQRTLYRECFRMTPDFIEIGREVP